jgi:hypothetical protein
MQIHQLESLNNELLHRCQNQKRNEDYLANSNHHVVVLQKRLDVVTAENAILVNRINQLGHQNYQLTQKW